MSTIFVIGEGPQFINKNAVVESEARKGNPAIDGEVCKTASKRLASWLNSITSCVVSLMRTKKPLISFVRIVAGKASRPFSCLTF